jgi:hypothetical protein
MRKLGFILVMALTFVLASCEKEDPCIMGTVRFTSLSANPYDLFIDNEFQARIQGQTFFEMKLSEGRHKAMVEQVSGYLLFPTKRETTLNVFGCQETEWVFPQ